MLGFLEMRKRGWVGSFDVCISLEHLLAVLSKSISSLKVYYVTTIKAFFSFCFLGFPISEGIGNLELLSSAPSRGDLETLE